MKCADCRYFQPAYIHGDHGECRRYAQSLWPHRSLEPGSLTTWPAVAPTSWCGQWESINTTTIVNGGVKRDHRGGVKWDRLAAASLSP